MLEMFRCLCILFVKPKSEVPKSKVPKSRPKGLGFCFFCFFDFYLHASRGDVSDQREGTHLGVLEVEVLHLQHDLPDDVIPTVAVEAQDHKVKGKNLIKVTSHQILFFAD